MNRPDIIGVEVITPDGRGHILSLHPKRVIVHLNSIDLNQKMRGERRQELHYSYKYEDVTIIKGQYCFDDNNTSLQYLLSSLNTIDSLPFDEYHKFRKWLTDEGWHESSEMEYDNHNDPNGCIRPDIKGLYIEYKRSSQ